jgi:hypothetical protein
MHKKNHTLVAFQKIPLRIGDSENTQTFIIDDGGIAMRQFNLADHESTTLKVNRSQIVYTSPKSARGCRHLYV